MTRDDFNKGKTILYNIDILKKELSFLSSNINKGNMLCELSIGLGSLKIPNSISKKILSMITKYLKEEISKLEKEFKDL